MVPSLVNLLPSGAVHPLQKYLSAHALDLDEDVVQSHLGSFLLEIMFLGKQVISPQNVYLDVLPHLLVGVPGVLLDVAEVLPRVLTSCPFVVR